MQNEVLQHKPRSLEKKTGGVCLEYLKGTCSKTGTCQFSHRLADYYAHVCKLKTFASVHDFSAANAILRIYQGMGMNSSQVPVEILCKQMYAIRALLPNVFAEEQSQAVISILVRCFIMPAL